MQSQAPASDHRQSYGTPCPLEVELHDAFCAYRWRCLPGSTNLASAALRAKFISAHRFGKIVIPEAPPREVGFRKGAQGVLAVGGGNYA